MHPLRGWRGCGADMGQMTRLVRQQSHLKNHHHVIFIEQIWVHSDVMELTWRCGGRSRDWKLQSSYMRWHCCVNNCFLGQESVMSDEKYVVWSKMYKKFELQLLLLCYFWWKVTELFLSSGGAYKQNKAAIDFVCNLFPLYLSMWRQILLIMLSLLWCASSTSRMFLQFSFLFWQCPTISIAIRDIKWFHKNAIWFKDITIIQVVAEYSVNETWGCVTWEKAGETFMWMWLTARSLESCSYGHSNIFFK